MRPDQSSHTIMRHGTAPQQTKPSRLTGCRPGRALGIRESFSSTPHKPQLKFQKRSRQTSLHKSWAHNQPNYAYYQCTQASCKRMKLEDYLYVQGVETSILCLPIIFQCNFGCTFKNKYMQAPNRRIQLHYAAPKGQRPDNRPINFRK